MHSNESGNEKSDEQVLRRSIIIIHNDSSLSSAEKAQKIQELMNPVRFISTVNTQNNPKRETASVCGLQGGLNTYMKFLEEKDCRQIKIDDDELLKSYHECDGIVNKEALGCKHYRTNCKFMASCCQKWYPCRFCHNEASDHELDRYCTKYCMCMRCNTIQRAGKICVNSECGIDLANYYCGICKFWDNDCNKPIFHCDKCGVCRKGTRENYVHCNKCNACLVKEYYNSHKCIERSLECDCPICGEYLFTTIMPIIFMPCGHGIHYLCHREHLQNSYQCPICLKSVIDMSIFFNQIDEMLAHHQMPAEYANIRSLVLCNDCEQKSSPQFHFVYHKCDFCKSYNTKVLKTFNEDESFEDEISNEEAVNNDSTNREMFSPNLEK